MSYCKLCGKEFTAKNIRLTLSVRRDWFIEKIRVCVECHEREMTKGE